MLRPIDDNPNKLIHLDMIEFVAFLLMAVVYLLVNRPFRRLFCHQDAGWHSYWAAFRAKGVTLRYQENVLLGCTRLGCAFLFALWFKLFGLRNPDRLARKVAQGGNLVVAATFILGGKTGLIDISIAWAIAGVFLLLMSLPTLAVHYETAERTVNPFDAFLFLGAVFVFTQPQSAWMGVYVFVAVLIACLFKVTQLAPYGLVWGALYFVDPSFEAFLFSVLGSFGALCIFVAILWRSDLLRRENLGVFGYSSHDASSANSEKFANFERKIVDKLGGGKFAVLASKLGKALGVEHVLRLCGSACSAKTFMPMVVGSLSGTIVMAVVGALFVNAPHITIALAWLLGSTIALLAQGRFFPFHCIALVLPTAILAAAGWWTTWEGALDGVLGFLALGALGILLTLYDLFKAFRGRADEDLNFRYWPAEMRPILRKNEIAEKAAHYVKDRSEADDYVLVLGTLPQFNLLAQRRSPINWLSTCARLMDPILPSWKAILFANLKTLRPCYVLDVDNEMPITEIEAAVGASYQREIEYGEQVCLYRINDQ